MNGKMPSKTGPCPPIVGWRNWYKRMLDDYSSKKQAIGLAFALPLFGIILG
jgi:hypothetical protein